MEWTKDLEIGVPEIDAQHQELIRRVNGLLDAGKTNRVQEMLAFLAEYVVMHFRDEEALMVESGYPALGAHKQEHEAFILTFQNLKKKFDDSGEDLDVLMSLNNAATDWLFTHIMGTDRRFAQYYRKWAKMDPGA